MQLHIFPNVFSPAYFTDSNWFARTIPKIVGNRSLLEIGTGTGIVALFAALNGANVTATDLNPSAAKNARYNFQKHGISARVYFGDMYEPLSKKEKFDFIFFNHPFAYGKNRDEKLLDKSVFDYKYSSLRKFVAGAHLHLKPSGRLLLASSNFASITKIRKIVATQGYKLKSLRQKKYSWRNNTLYLRIYQLVK